MLRISLALLLVCASAQALAQNGRHAASNATVCQETEALARDEAARAGPSQPKASARSKYAKPAPVHGGDDDQGLPRTRGSKWHSFLPGMFR